MFTLLNFLFNYIFILTIPNFHLWPIGLDIKHRELSSVLGGDLDVHDEGKGKSQRDGTYAYLEVIHFIVEQRLTQHCESNYISNKNKVQLLFLQ